MPPVCAARQQPFATTMNVSHVADCSDNATVAPAKEKARE
jgi:hypothetical protein